MNNIPRSEYPRPQFVRPSWMNLNGQWQFEIDHGASGRARGLVEKNPLDMTITVPFCPESDISGVGYKDFMAAVWYRRTFTLPAEAAGQRVIVHFGAVDYKCEVWVNGQSVGVHEGGYASFSFEITDAVVEGENVIVVCADDNLRGGKQPYGKQCNQFHSRGCSYTRTTGIWQTVWIEWVPAVYVKSTRMSPDCTNGCVYIDAFISGKAAGMTLTAEASFEGKAQGTVCTKVDGNHAKLTVAVEDIHLWGPGEGNLYDLKLTLKDGETVVDAVDSYFALRTVSFDGKKCLINGKPVFQRLVLDQGFYPDGVCTAPTDEALRGDIELSMAMGFNGARLHQKVFEQRFLYHADKLGYICWGEMASWGADPSRPHIATIFLREWLEVVERDFNAPCIVGWCPYNEVWGESNEGLRQLTLQATYRATKAADPTRPCIDTSGGFHVETDIFDTHDYEQSGEVYEQRYQPGAELYDQFAKGPRRGQQQYDGKLPMFVSEYGGIGWSVANTGWSYGNAPKTEEEFIERYTRLTTALMKNPEHMGFCYTQLTDVEQEQNGLYTYHRVPKFPTEIISAVNRQPAAIEED